MKTTALIVAAGAGTRMRLARPKAFADLAGRPLMEYSLDLFQRHARVDDVLLMAPPGDVEAASRVASRYSKVVGVEEGGDRRQDTVRLGLARVTPGERDIVLVHDAARPLADERLVSRVLDAAVRSGAAVPGIVPSDTVRQVREMADPQGRTIGSGTLDRERLMLVQTPQGFDVRLLREAYDRCGAIDATDDAALVEMMGGVVEIVAGSSRNIKVTVPGDLRIAAALLASREEF